MKNKRKKFLLDADGVLFDFVGGYLDGVVAVSGVRYPREKADRYDIDKALGLDEAVTKVVRKEVVKAPGFCRRLAVYPGAVEGVAELRRHVDLKVVTTPYVGSWYWYAERVAALEEHFDVEERDVVFMSEKQDHFGDFILDDKASTVRRFNAAWPASLGILWPQHTNVHDREGLVVAESWGHLLQLVVGA